MRAQIIILLTLVVVVTVFAGTAAAQFTLDQDVLGAHNINGRGCVSCHQPHSGSAGAGGTDTSTGTIVLWGRSFLGKTYTTYGGTTLTTYPTVASFINGTKDPLYRTAICLTCHDGSASITGMHGTTVETVDGGSAHAPTYLATDAEGLTNDHPVHIPYVPAAAPGGKHWAGTVDANGKVWWMNDPAQAAFVAAYGHAGSLYGAAAGGTTIGSGTPSTAAGAYVECTSCHDHHSMTRHRQSIGQVWTPTANCNTGGATDPFCGSFAGGTSAVYPTRMFVKGWYDSNNPASNSSSQFCRSCHADRSNENYGINSITF
jgi:hypothetical protein